MGNKNRNLLLAGLAAGAYAYFSKKENRDKAMVSFNNLKTKVDSFMETQKLNRDDDAKAGFSDPYDLQDNDMVAEGAQTSVHYYNQEVQDNKKLAPDEDGLYHKKETGEPAGGQGAKLGGTDADQEHKQENTDTVTDENRISTENL
ncbi:hypothetical protein [Edaphobacillus lindanitolerans]|uniref:Uncharacterized protein n=1 Tax=Edaphobacillus lindanitolerans TaxID=550447 RepID=A0A1U7PM78_9BACI|nr:hypothetical protein [Edaphobacillus lindanitolerans]SIT89459.1 hypothetical protein SAMN05428946_2415 [Edaphobacillus lindanitolerans]